MWWSICNARWTNTQLLARGRAPAWWRHNWAADNTNNAPYGVQSRLTSSSLRDGALRGAQSCVPDNASSTRLKLLVESRLHDPPGISRWGFHRHVQCDNAQALNLDAPTAANFGAACGGAERLDARHLDDMEKARSRDGGEAMYESPYIASQLAG